MGRELMRVPLDFAWPMGMRWKGYLNPYRSQKCDACDGSGLNPETKRISDDFYDFACTGRRWKDRITQDETDALVAEGRLRKWVGKWVTVPRTAAEVNAANGPNGSMLGDMAHDAINRWILIEARAKRLGVYGNCNVCDGAGEVWFSDEIRRLHDEWVAEGPPAGDGFQLWETTSEGSPSSPVFGTLDELCAWCADNATTFASFKASAEEWRRMLDAGFVSHTEGNAVFL